MDQPRAGRSPLDDVKRHGVDAVSFQALESGLSWWRDTPAPSGTGAALAYAEAGRSWIAVGSPLVAVAQRAQAARRFSEAARAHRRRAVFFGVEQLEPFGGFSRMLLGMQPVLLPSLWAATLRAAPRLREQLRRARAKGVTVRVVSPGELMPGAPLRVAVDALQRQWLASRPVEPMGFLVSVEPFHHSQEHLYIVAEKDGRAVQFLSAVPVPASHAWLLEDMLRAPGAPNGTTELMIDQVMRTCDHEGVWITLGLTPLAGPVSRWLRAVSFGAKPLYDFTGLRRFRARLHPAEWRPVWLVWDRGPVAFVLLDVLRAFARGRLLSFAWRSFTRHPNGPPWIVAVPLVPWTLALLVLLLTGQSAVLGFSNTTLAAWIVFDTLMVWALFRTALRPRVGALLALALAAGGDAAWSLRHLVEAGFGEGVWSGLFRLLSATGPVVGTVALVWAAYTARRVRNSRRRNQRFSAT